MTDAPTSHPTPVPYLAAGRYALRPFERADAAGAAAWWPEPYPVNTPEALRWLEARLRERYAAEQLLAIVRADGGQPLGVLHLRCSGNLHADLAPRFGALVPSPEQAAAAAAALTAVVPWLLAERDFLGVLVTLPADLPIEGAASALGLRRVGAYREALARPGPANPAGRVDLAVYEALNPAWTLAWAPPAEPLPARRPDPVDLGLVASLARPGNAVAVGRRVYLRPLEPEDAPTAAGWHNAEPEAFFDAGRRPRSPLTLALAADGMYGQRPPEEITLGVCAVADGHLVGRVGVEGLDWVNRTGETFSYLAPDTRNLGFGTEAKMLLLAYCFERLGLHAVRSAVYAFNRRSAVALLKQGYRHLGTVRTQVSKGGRFQEDLLFDLLARDWFALRQAAR